MATLSNFFSLLCDSGYKTENDSCDSYWEAQFLMYNRGQRNFEMHDATLVIMETLEAMA